MAESLRTFAKEKDICVSKRIGEVVFLKQN